jgi:glucose-1-phosphate adenylyltransferase
MEIGINHDHDKANGFRVTDKGVVLVTMKMVEALEGNY